MAADMEGEVLAQVWDGQVLDSLMGLERSLWEGQVNVPGNSV